MIYNFIITLYNVNESIASLCSSFNHHVTVQYILKLFTIIYNYLISKTVKNRKIILFYKFVDFSKRRDEHRAGSPEERLGPGRVQAA